MRNLFDKSDIAIDLTSLLDVIFIVLLVVMCSQRIQTDESVAKAQEVAQLAEEAQQTIDDYENHMQKYEETEEYVLFIDVTARYTSAEVSKRVITVMSGIMQNGEESGYTIEIAPGTEKDGYADLSRYLEAAISEYEEGNPQGGRPVILSVNKNDEDILYRDEVAIENIFEELLKKHANIYLR